MAAVVAAVVAVMTAAAGTGQDRPLAGATATVQNMLGTPLQGEAAAVDHQHTRQGRSFGSCHVALSFAKDDNWP